MSFMTKEERDALWTKIRERNSQQRADERTPPAVEWSVVERDGELFVICPWRQELPAHGAVRFFWRQLEHIKKNLSDRGTKFSLSNEFLVGHPDPGRGTDDIRNFCEWMLKDAHDRALEEENSKLEKIEEVRQSVKYYEEEP